MRYGDLSERVAIVTGGARGLGLAIARQLGSDGVRVALADVDELSAATSASELQLDGIGAMEVACDVASEEACERAAALVWQRWDRLDICVNCAGIVEIGPAEDMTRESWQRVIDINLTGAFLMSKASARWMKRRGRGNIINIASMSGLIVTVPQKQAAYNCSKAGLIMLTKSLAAEWSEFDIRVNAIAPGYVNTTMTARASDAIQAVWKERTPMKRLGNPSEIAEVAAFLASDASSFITGAAIMADGGYTVL